MSILFDIDMMDGGCFDDVFRFEGDRSMMDHHLSLDKDAMNICGLKNLKNMEIGEDSRLQNIQHQM